MSSKFDIFDEISHVKRPAENKYPLLRDPYESELDYFKKNPKVAGMATEDDRVIFNPFSEVHPKGSDSVYQNESSRISMRNSKNRPSFKLTPKQQKAFKGYGSEQDIRETIAARALSGDPSAGDLTEEQKSYVGSLSEGEKKDDIFDQIVPKKNKYTRENTRSIKPIIKESPGAAAASVGLGIASPIDLIEHLTNPARTIQLGQRMAQKAMGEEQSKAPPTLLDQLRQLNLEDLPEDQKQGAEILEVLGSLLPTGWLTKLLPKGKLPISKGPSAGSPPPPSVPPRGPPPPPPKSPKLPPPPPPRPPRQPPPPPPPTSPSASARVPSAPAGTVTAAPEYLKSDFELAEDIRKHLSPLQIESTSKAVSTPRTVQTLFRPVEGALNEISPHRINNPNLLGRTAERTIKEVDQRVYQQTKRDWTAAKEIAGETVELRPELVSELNRIIRETPPPVRGGEAKASNFAETLLNQITRRRSRRGGVNRTPTSVSNRTLVQKIINAREGYDYRYIGGVEGHRINQFIQAVERELLHSSGGAERQALLNARNSSADWATRFKNPQVLPYRNQKNTNPQALYQRALTPDTFNTILPILDETPRGRTLAGLLRRNMAEKVLEPYLLRPQSMNPAKLQRDLGKLQGILPPEQLQHIEQTLQNHHAQSLQKPPTGAAAKRSFAQMSESEISSKLRNVEGLRELKAELATTPEGEKLYDQVARTQGIDLLFGGQMSIPNKSERIAKMLNDRNGRHYLAETLGQENVKVLDDLVKENQLKKRLQEIADSPDLSEFVKDPVVYIKGAGLLKDILMGRPISAIKKSYDLFKKYRAAKSGPVAPDVSEGVHIE